MTRAPLPGARPGHVEVFPGVFRANQVKALRSVLEGRTTGCRHRANPTAPAPRRYRSSPRTRRKLVGTHDTDSVVAVIEAFKPEPLIRMLGQRLPLSQWRTGFERSTGDVHDLSGMSRGPYSPHVRRNGHVALLVLVGGRGRCGKTSH